MCLLLRSEHARVLSGNGGGRDKNHESCGLEDILAKHPELNGIPHTQTQKWYEKVLGGESLPVQKRAEFVGDMEYGAEEALDGYDATVEQDVESVGEANNDELSDSGESAPVAGQVEDLADLAEGGAEPAADGVAELVHLRRFYFACFRMTPKAPQQGGGRFGGYEAQCPFHRKSRQTACKKWSGLQGPLEAHRRDALRRLHLWCLSYKEHSRQRHHVGTALIQDVDAAYPGQAWVVAQARLARADCDAKGQPVPDDELDRDEGITVPRQRLKKGAKSKAKPKPEAKAMSQQRRSGLEAQAPPGSNLDQENADVQRSETSSSSSSSSTSSSTSSSSTSE